MKGHIGLIVLLALVVGVGSLVAWRAVTHSHAEAAALAAKPPTVAVEVAPIERGVLRDVRVLSGTLQASTRFDVATKVGGLIERVAVDLGDEVQRGQVVAVIDDAELVQAAAQAEAELAVRRAEEAQAAAELKRVQRDYERLQSFSERGVASDAELDEISAQLEIQRAALTLAESRVRQAGAALELATIRLNDAVVRAEWDGGPDAVTVGERYEDAGNTVASGDPVVAVVGLDPLTAVVSITERDYTRLRVGQAARLETDAIAGRVFAAEIVRIAPVFRETSRQARIELRVDNGERLLKPGMFARVSLVLREEPAETVVPLAALTRRDGRDVVFVLDEGGQTVRMVPVEAEIVDGERVGVRGAGLRGRVVVLGQQQLTDGSAVSVYEGPAATQRAGAGADA